jgi:hypothetical protein
MGNKADGDDCHKIWGTRDLSTLDIHNNVVKNKTDSANTRSHKKSISITIEHILVTVRLYCGVIPACTRFFTLL